MLRMMEPQAWGVHGSQILVSAGHGMLQACWEVKKEYVPNNSTLREASGVMMIKEVGGRISS